MNKVAKNLSTLTLFGIAMGFLEAAVVVYLRKIYYPQGFLFPLNPNISSLLLNIEWLREISTIIMLACIGIIIGRNFSTRFCYFLYSFAVWDIFYYIWLKVVLNWPSSLLTWDILFLIPLPWVSPVLAPIIVSLTMIVLAVTVIWIDYKKHNVKGLFHEWFLCIIGVFAIFITFIWDYANLIIRNKFYMNLLNLGINSGFQKIVSQYVPTNYNWWLFLSGEVLILFSFGLFCKRMKDA